MSITYNITTNFGAKDSLNTGDSNKVVRGSEFTTEFTAIKTALALAAPAASPTFTGTLTFGSISDGAITVTAFVDEDDMASNSATLIPTQQSVKAYVDSQLTAQDLDFQADSGGALSIDLDSETMTFTGGTGIDTSGSGNAVTFAIDSTVATLTGSQTLTNKTLTAPTISGNLTTNGTIDGRDVATDGAKLDGIEASADVTDTANVTAAGALMDSELTSIASVKALNQGVATSDSPTFAGLTTTANVSFGDNDKAVFGAGSDLQIYHDGSDSYIQDSGAGDLRLKSNGSGVKIEDAGNTLAFFDTVTNNAKLYHNSNQKLETTGTGIDVTGTVTADGLTVESAADAQIRISDSTSANQRLDLEHNAGVSEIISGNNGAFGSIKIQAFNGTSTVDRLQIKPSGDIEFYEDTGTTAKMFWDASAESLGIGTTSPQVSLHTIGSAVIGTQATGASYEGVVQIADGALNGRTMLLMHNNHPDQFIKIGQDENTALIGRDNADELAFGVFDNAADTTLTKQMVITSSGNVGIGLTSNTSASSKLQVLGNGITVSDNVTDANAKNSRYFGVSHVNQEATMMYLSATSTNNVLVVGGGTSLAEPASIIKFHTGNTGTKGAGTERMRIALGGTVMVGKTSSNAATVGVELRQDGTTTTTASGTAPLVVNRTTSDGNVAEFRKDGNAIGNIGAFAGDMTIGTSDNKVRFFDGSSAISPCVDAGTINDNAIDLGVFNSRFKNLYLSGGAYLGGTATANKLDDYEEGTWTPVLSDGTNTVTLAVGAYTKVGRIVTCVVSDFNEDTSSLSGNVKITGLPFTSSGKDQGVALYYRDGGTAGESICAFIGNGSTEMIIRENRGAANSAVNVSAASTTSIFSTFTYQAST